MDSIEKSVLATVLMADTFPEIEYNKISQVELYEEWFNNKAYKIIVKIINNMKIKSKPIYFEIVRKEAIILGYNLDDTLIDIVTANPFSYNTFIAYYNDLNKSNKSNMQRLI